MSITVPTIYTPVHQEEINTSTATEEAFRKMVQNSNYLLNLRPLKSIVFLEVNQSGVPPIDLSVWQECGGTLSEREITNPNSPLRSMGAVENFVPDFRDKYPRVTTGAGGPNGPIANTTASLTIQDLTYSAKEDGINGNNLSVEYITDISASVEMIDALTLQVTFPTLGLDADAVKALVEANTIAAAKFNIVVSGTGTTAQTTPVAQANLFGGFGSNQTHNLIHDHSGFTQPRDNVPAETLQFSGDRRFDQLHIHALAQQFTATEFFDAPAFLKLIAYMRIV